MRRSTATGLFATLSLLTCTAPCLAGQVAVQWTKCVLWRSNSRFVRIYG